MAVLVATVDGYHVLTSSGAHHTALEGHKVAALTPGPAGSWIAIVDDHEIWQHGADGTWTAIARSELELSSLVTVADAVFAGTVGPRMLQLGDDAQLAPLPGFDSVSGRDEWHAVGSDLEVRSLTATADGAVLLASVHVGGIARSDDGGASWHPTIDVEADVHQVCAHPTEPSVVVAAAAVGLCTSHDAGRTWSVVTDGLHATYARAVTFDGDDVLLSVSTGPFTKHAAIYRFADGRGGERVRDGLPEWQQGNVDTRCLYAANGRLALADGAGAVWATTASNDGRAGAWTLAAEGLPWVNAVVVV